MGTIQFCFFPSGHEKVTLTVKKKSDNGTINLWSSETQWPKGTTYSSVKRKLIKRAKEKGFSEGAIVD